MPPATLRISQSQLDRIIAQARARPGAEVCGLLGGDETGVRHVYPVRNSSPTPAVHFLMCDQTFVDAFLDIDAKGWDLLAIYHSHPAGIPAEPSPTDIANASYPDALNLIISFHPDGDVVARVFKIAGWRASEEVLEIIPDVS